ncbi:restriction endonuclease [Streptomyces noursei]|uniref:restriction endonuclease n=1 Tax=Streptomyces noursei TaxID=1971 RepID=UPI0016725FC5
MRLKPEEIDGLTPGEFELFVSALLEACECWGSACRGGYANDRAADVLAVSRSGRYMPVQCKHTKGGKNVGVRVTYEVLGTASPDHGATLALVVANGGFTKDARDYARRHGIRTIGRDRLIRAALGEVSLHSLLRLDSAPVAGPSKLRSPDRHRSRLRCAGRCGSIVRMLPGRDTGTTRSPSICSRSRSGHGRNPPIGHAGLDEHPLDVVLYGDRHRGRSPPVARSDVDRRRPE